VRNPLIVATAAGLLVNVLGITVPDWLAPSLSRIGAASLALGLMAAGAGMQFATLARGKLLAISVLSIRHLILPLIGWALGRALHLDATQAAVLLAFAAVPTASSAYVLAARMGYNGPFVAGLVTMSTVLGVASLPFALSLPR
jgi:predicted permease